MPSSKKSPQDHKFAANKWKNKNTELECPSGQWCLVRRPGIQGLIKNGVLHSIDQLTALVQTETIPKAEGRPQVSAEALMADPKKIESALEMMDKIVMFTVIEPKLHPVPANDEDRDDDLVYIDDVELDDKSFIMNFAVGGSADLQRFREESALSLGSVPHGVSS